ncbi:MAG: bifunctional class I SAM-dependent methyltransferase/glycosyltransferase family 2 protein [Bacteroidota bacterium]|nr:bifunctional class I SAM-dependent methyltransferase/glycosyltransferase family 2 protein [Bacteroidota bacterium]
MDARSQKIQQYFDSIAPQRVAYRKSKAYYWNSLTRYCDYFLHDDYSVLEIGCGTGELLANVKGGRKVGIDISPKMIDEARKQFPDLRFEVMDAEEITLTGKFDVIILSNLVGWLTDIEKCLCEIQKLCHPRTRIIVTYYNYLWEPLIKLAESLGLKKKSPNQNWLTRSDIINILKLSDYDVYRHNRNMLIPFNIPGISYLFNRFLSKVPGFSSLALNQFIFARPDIRIFKERPVYSTSVVIPARNESGNIENAVLRLPDFGKHVEIIFVEGNSTDDTWDKIQEIQEKYKDKHDIKIARQDGKGKADAVRKGYEMATGDILMILDADLTVPPEDIPKFYEAIATGKGEFINGSRLVYPMEKNAMRFLNILGNKFFSMAFSWVFEQPVKDTLCGTKVIFRDDYVRLKSNRKFFGDFDPFGDFDLLFGAYKLNLKIIDLPIRYQERTYGDTNISRFKHGLILLRMWLYAIGKIKFW